MNRDTRRSRVLLALLLVTSIGLITVDYRASADGGRSPLAGLRDLASSVFGPLEEGAASVAGPIGELVDDVGSLGRAEDELASLRRQNARLTNRLRSAGVDRSRVAEVDALLRLAGAGRYRVVPAQVIAVGSAQTFTWTVTIDAGRRDGVRRDMTVVNGDGLVGRVTSVGRSTATVALLVDPDSSVGVRMEGSGELGYTTGEGVSSALALQLLDAQSTVVRGDRLVTFGSQDDMPYVPGVPVGVVRKVQASPGSQTRSARVEPYVDFSALDIVGVVVEPPRKDPRDAVLPPRPSRDQPAPTPTVTVTVTAEPQ